jgi:hypothetical protein
MKGILLCLPARSRRKCAVTAPLQTTFHLLVRFPPDAILLADYQQWGEYQATGERDAGLDPDAGGGVLGRHSCWFRGTVRLVRLLISSVIPVPPIQKS